MGFTSTISSLRGWHFYATNPLKISPVLLLSVTCTDMQPSPLPAEEDRPVGMEALEALHNQIQILVKKTFINVGTPVALHGKIMDYTALL